MITLTEKEKTLTQHLLNNNDGTDAHICSDEWIDLKEINMNMKTLKGVFGSLVQKGILVYSDQNDNGEIYRWCVPVDDEQKEMRTSYGEIKTVHELLTAIKKQKEAA